MWVKLAGQMGRTLLANLAQVSVVRMPVEGTSGSQLSLASGFTMPLKESPEAVLGHAGEGRAGGLWLRLTGQPQGVVFANFELARVAQAGPGRAGGSKLVFLPEFAVYVQESPEDILARLAEFGDLEAARTWHMMAADNGKPMLVNAARVATVGAAPARAGGAQIAFVGGGQIIVRESTEEIMRLLKDMA